MVIPRSYQAEAIEAALSFFRNKKEKKNGLIIAPTASGKSVIIANIIAGLKDHVIVLQPNSVILAQNFQKYVNYGFRAGIYSASAGAKYVDTCTFATIGSIISKPHLFYRCKYMIIDECHEVNPKEGRYLDFIEMMKERNPDFKVIGLTATPYRLHSNMEGSMLRFITRTTPRIFNKVIYNIQKKTLYDAGFLAPVEYFAFNMIDRLQLEVNSTGSDFTERSVKAYYKRNDIPSKTASYANRVLAKRKNLLVFVTTVDEAFQVAAKITGALVLHSKTGEDAKKDIIRKFITGIAPCVVNVGVLTTGFDFPGLEAVLMARSTMSLALYEQIVGRLMRPFTYADGTKKTGWFIDLGGNVQFFGKVETMHVGPDHKGLYTVINNGKQLTNVFFTKSAA